MGLAYKVTGNTTYRDKALQLLDYINTFAAAGITAPALIDSSYATRTVLPAVALAYDWFFDSLTPTEKTASYITLNAWWDDIRTLGNPPVRCWADGLPSGTDPVCWADNYWSGHIMGLGLAGLATANENPRG